jgi:hypothetical protein
MSPCEDCLSYGSTISRKPWAFPIVGAHSHDGTTEYFKYTPNSDFHLSFHGLPCILLEVVSDEHSESDRYRMLIQASCVARFANTFRKPDTPPFVVMAIYFNKISFDRYLVYQPDIDRRVRKAFLSPCNAHNQLRRHGTPWNRLTSWIPIAAFSSFSNCTTMSLPHVSIWRTLGTLPPRLNP